MYKTGRHKVNWGTGPWKPHKITEERSTDVNTPNKRKTKHKVKKVRTFPDGILQICYTTKEDASLLTILLEALFTILIINAHKGKYVEIFDVHGAYLYADMK